jgi:hypothetical protein
MHTHAHGQVARLRTLHATAATAKGNRLSVGSVQDFEPHRLQFQSGLKRLEKIGEEGAP